MPPIIAADLTAKPKNKKIIFDEEGEITVKAAAPAVKKTKKKKSAAQEDESNAALETQQKDAEEAKDDHDDEEEEDYFTKRDKQRRKQQENKGNKKDEDAQKKWFNVYPQFPSSDEVLDIKDTEQMELYNICKSAFESEMTTFNKRNPSDARWLQTALHKGTAKDRANAGALLVTSNPLGNLDALTTLISFTKLSNKASTEVTAILTDLWKEVLLPPHRKLISLQMRGADWKLVRKDATLSKEKQKRIFAYWHFENEIKDRYFEYLKNLQQGIQTGQENNKNNAIVSASQLLAYAPEKEQMLLTMIINKLGDPIAKIASKALHHLTDVAHKHPNMCGVIVTETEKLLFRNNISDRAQHFALCFLSSIAPAGRPEVCTKLVHICFALFKVLVQKGAVNNRTMQAILRCLQKAILEARPADGSTEILSKEMQDTVYRLVHLADIRVSVQTLGLLLQLITVKTEKSDRFYNALYKKMLDIEVSSIGVKTAAQLLHIIHRAIHIDSNVPRAQAFVKRLLQLALYMPPHMAAGCLIVIHKLLRSRKELTAGGDASASDDTTASQAKPILPQVSADDAELAKFDSDGEEKYQDVSEEADKNATEPMLTDEKENVKESTTVSSWHHAKVNTNAALNGDAKVQNLGATKYDPYHRAPAYAGAEFALRNELLLLREHFHPTVQVFAENILKQNRIDYYGDPLRDFGLPHFLERFAFKNPKKLDNQKAETPTVEHKRYVSFGSRGKPVKSLTKANCTEEEMFIFNFLEHKRKQSIVNKAKKSDNDEEGEEDEELKAGEVNDDEFDQYLDGFFSKKTKGGAQAENADDDDEEELDFLKELGGELKDDTKPKKQKIKQSAVAASAENDDEVDDIDADWGDDDNEVGDGEFANNSDSSDDEDGSINGDEIDEENDDDDDEGSISLDETMGDDEVENMTDSEGSDSENDDDEDDDDEDDDDELAPPKSKKSRKNVAAGMDGKNFAKKLKHSSDMSSLFAAADDFAELLEETGKSKGQGTTNAVFNKDKSSDKQMKWEEKRHSNKKSYMNKKGKFGGGGKPFSKKRKL